MTRRLCSVLVLAAAAALAACAAPAASGSGETAPGAGGSAAAVAGGGTPAGAADAGGSGSGASAGTDTGAGDPVVGSGCHPGDPLAGVYHPYRLSVEQACITVTGTVDCVKHEADGDTHIRLRVDDRWAALLRPGNAAQRCSGSSGPHLVVEGIPQHCGPQAQSDASDNCADRGGFTTPAEPLAGDHVTVTGPLVVDNAAGHQGWAEIHPAEVISGGTAVGMTTPASVLDSPLALAGGGPPAAAAARCASTGPGVGPDHACRLLADRAAADLFRLVLDLADEND